MTEPGEKTNLSKDINNIQNLQSQATTDFCICFYRNLIAGRTINEAFKLSKLELRTIIKENSAKYCGFNIDNYWPGAALFPDNGINKNEGSDPIHDVAVI